MESCEKERAYLLWGCAFVTCLVFLVGVGMGMSEMGDGIVLACLAAAFLIVTLGAMLLFSTGAPGIVMAGRALMWIGWLLLVAAIVKAVLPLMF